MELMSKSVGIFIVLPVSDLGNAAVQRNADKLYVYFCASAADWRWSLVCFHNHCLFYVSVGVLTELILHSVFAAYVLMCFLSRDVHIHQRSCDIHLNAFPMIQYIKDTKQLLI